MPRAALPGSRGENRGAQDVHSIPQYSDRHYCSTQQLRTLIGQWTHTRGPSKRELLSLLGHLSHAATVIPPGRTFVRHLINAASQEGDLQWWLTFALHHFASLNVQCRADLQWYTVVRRGNLATGTPNSLAYFGRVRHMGVRGISVRATVTRLVSIAEVGGVGERAHLRQGNGPSSGCCSSLGSVLDPFLGCVPFRQLASGRRNQLRDVL